MFICHLCRLFIIVLCLNSSWSTFSPKILGGRKIRIEEAAYSAQFFNAGGFCGSTVLTSWALLTAAHCFDLNEDVDYMFVRVGNNGSLFDDPNAETHYVLQIQKHEKYNHKITFSHDIALVFVQDHFKLRSTVQRALLPTNMNFLSDYTPKAFRASGWGWTSYPKGKVSDKGLMAVNMTLVELRKCAKIHNVTMSHDMFCLYGGINKDTCRGDSGGGIIWKSFLVGVVSHGDGCGTLDKPSVYINVWHFNKWIAQKLNYFENNHCKPNKQREHPFLKSGLRTQIDNDESLHKI